MAFTLAEILGAALAPGRPIERKRRDYCAVTGKACFDSKEEAQQTARETNGHELHCNKAYRCDWCTKIHIGRRGRRG
jgi:hypothetical protein